MQRLLRITGSGPVDTAAVRRLIADLLGAEFEAQLVVREAVRSQAAELTDRQVRQAAMRMNDLVRFIVTWGPDLDFVISLAGVTLAAAELTATDVRFEIDGRVEGVAMAQVVCLLRMVGGPHKIRVCDPFPERDFGTPEKRKYCGRLFVKEGKREQCSTSCTKRVYMRAWNSGQRGKGLSSDGKQTRKE